MLSVWGNKHLAHLTLWAAVWGQLFITRDHKQKYPLRQSTHHWANILSEISNTPRCEVSSSSELDSVLFGMSNTDQIQSEQVQTKWHSRWQYQNVGICSKKDYLCWVSIQRYAEPVWVNDGLLSWERHLSFKLTSASPHLVSIIKLNSGG